MSVMEWRPPLGGKLNIEDDAPEALEVVVAADASPLDFLQAVFRDPSQPMQRRMKAAEVAAPYAHPKIAVVASLDAEFANRIEEMMRGKGLNPVIDAPRKALDSD